MTSNQNSSEDDSRVVSFRSGRPVAKPAEPPVEDLAKYQGPESKEEYRDRMIVNVAAFAFIAVLVAAGWWLAGTMAQIRKTEDCAASGRRNCVPIEYKKDRW
jgi:hypothetical protein